MDLESILKREDVPSDVKQILQRELEKAKIASERFREERKLLEETIMSSFEMQRKSL